jgi:hypothetical protein
MEFTAAGFRVLKERPNCEVPSAAAVMIGLPHQKLLVRLYASILISMRLDSAQREASRRSRLAGKPRV